VLTCGPESVAAGRQIAFDRRVRLPVGYEWIPPRSQAQRPSIDPRLDVTSALLIGGLALVLAIPTVAKALDVAPRVASCIVLTYMVYPVLGLLFGPAIRRRPRLDQARVMIELLHGVAIVSALAAATGDPLAPLWSLSVMYAALDGGDYDAPPSVAQLAIHGLGPLVAIPAFLATNVPRAYAVGVPLVFAATASLAYGSMARRAVVVRASFAERDAMRTRVIEGRRDLEREGVIRRLSNVLEGTLGAARTGREGASADDGAIAHASRRSLAELRSTMEALEAPEPPSAPMPGVSRGPLYRLMPTRASVHAQQSRRAERLGLPLSIAVPVVLAAAVPVVGGDPASALWSLAVVYATIDGSDYDVEASWLQLALHCGVPLATIPVFLARGAPLASALGGTVFVASTCFMGFHYTAVRARVVREVRAERALLEAELARIRAVHDRELLARDLHDTVGANLSLAALYADLLARDGGDRARTRQLSAALEGATAQGLEDLRMLLDGLGAEAHDLDTLAGVLRARAGRLAHAVGVSIDVQVLTRTGTIHDAEVAAAVRDALVRVAHEATSNAIRHGRASSVSIALAHEGSTIMLRVRDNGHGFDPAAVRPGRGLPSMRLRALELGGSFDVASSGDGTCVTVRMPACQG